MIAMSSIWSLTRTNANQIECDAGPTCPQYEERERDPELRGVVHFHDVEDEERCAECGQIIPHAD